MNHQLFSISLIVCLLFACASQTGKNSTQSSAPDQKIVSGPEAIVLTPAEKADGWQILFDGNSTDGWHNYQQDQVEGWRVENGELITSGKTGDIVSDDEFENFELYIEWNVSPKGNSGIMYLVQEDEVYDSPYKTGPEYQIIDDVNYPADLEEVQKTGANYAIDPPMVSAANPAGEYNTTRIVVNQGKVEHWLNGQMVVAYELWTKEWEEAVAKTKFKDMPGYAKSRKGKIALQDHSDPVKFRNIKIRRL